MALIKVQSEQIRTPSTVSDSPIVARQGRLVVGQPTEAVSELTEDTSYDAGAGVLSLVFTNGRTLRVEGFPTISDVPVGRQGPRGETGQDGKDGRDGNDGRPGEGGCAGVAGPEGEMGPQGPDGRPGQRGPDGNPGPTGPTGPKGPRGDTGERGETGGTGPDGAPGPTGSTGAPGPVGNLPIIVSTVQPSTAQDGWLWVNPNADTMNLWP